MIIFEVRFVYYQYNSGRADNGLYTGSRRYNTLPLAQEFAQMVKQKVKSVDGDSYLWLWEEFHIDGYVKRFDGIYEITERKVS